MQNEISELLQKDIDELTMAIERSKGVLTDSPFIIVIDGLPIDFDVSASGKVSNPRVGKPHLVHRFSQVNARSIAETVQDGRGYHGTAIPWHRAAYSRIAMYQDLLVRLLSKEVPSMEVVK